MAHRDSDEDSPWLAEAGDAPETRVTRRSLFWTVLVLLVLAAVAAVGMIVLLSKKDNGSTQGYMEAGQAPLITAEPGPYKIAPADPRGLAVEGQDQTLYAAGEGIDEGSVIDQSAVPEAPMARPGSAAATGPGSAATTGPGSAPLGLPRDLVPEGTLNGTPVIAPPNTAVPVPPRIELPKTVAPKPVAPKPVPIKPVPVKPEAAKVEVAKPAGTATLVQLGAFSSEAKADAAWAGLAAKHGMGGFGKRISPVERGGKTLWRLRGSGGDAAALCARLKAAGDACSVVE